MDLLEYQGKTLFASVGIPVPHSRLVQTLEVARQVASEVDYPLTVKAQVLAGGRGKAGGVQTVADGVELLEAAERILALRIAGRPVSALLLEETVEIDREYYLAIVLDRAAKCPLLLFSRHGGVDIEEVARREPEAVLRIPIDPLLGMREFQLRRLMLDSGLAVGHQMELAEIVRRLWSLYQQQDAILAEINPLALVRPSSGAAGDQPSNGGPGSEPAETALRSVNRMIALDAKLRIDDNALYRHCELKADDTTGDVRERLARAAGFAYVSLDGEIGVLGNGAGLVMGLLDQISAAGGRAANFLDVGGGASEERIAAALEILLGETRVQVLLISIFGGITRCDTVACGLLAALAQTEAQLPVVVAMAGTNAQAGLDVLETANDPRLVVAHDSATAVSRAVALISQCRDDECRRRVESRS